MKRILEVVAGVVGFIAFVLHNVRVTVRGIRGEEADE